MASTIFDEAYERQTLPLLTAKFLVDNLYQLVYKVYICPLVIATNIVCLATLGTVKYGVESTGMVADIEPVAYIPTCAVYRKRTAVDYIIYKQRYELLGILPLALVVRAVGDDRG